MSYNVSNPVPRQHGARSTTVVNDAYYPGPGGKMHSWKRNLAPEPPKTPLGLLGLVVVAGGSRTARYWALSAGVVQLGASCGIAVRSVYSSS